MDFSTLHGKAFGFQILECIVSAVSSKVSSSKAQQCGVHSVKSTQRGAQLFIL